MIKTLLVLLLSLLTLPSLAQGEDPSASSICREPYPWYPKLCLDDIPFHTGAGPWGPQEPIRAPSEPVTRRRASVDTAREFERAAGSPGTLITVTANLGPVAALIDMTDIDVVINPGVRVQSMTLGWGSRPGGKLNRVRVRGPTVGQYSGGSMGFLHLYGTGHSDIIIDGIGISGQHPEDPSQPMFYPAAGTDRLAVVNVCAHTGQLFALGGGGHTVYAGNRLASGANRDPGRGTSRWTIRHGDAGPLVVYDSRIESLSKPGEASYHRLRQSPRTGSARMYVWASDLLVVDRAESRGIWGARVEGNAPTDQITAYWAVDSEAYLQGDPGNVGFPNQGWQLAHVERYARATGVNFYGAVTRAMQEGNEKTTEAADADFTTDTTYNAWREPPEWGEPCDPTKLPL